MPETDTAADTEAEREIPDVQVLREQNKLVRDYRADGYLFAFRDGDEHVIVARGREPPMQWTETALATRHAVLPGEELWTIPSNWEQRVSIDGVGNRRYAIYHIPETNVDVLVTVPAKNHLTDAWFGVKRVGTLSVEYDDEIDWEELENTIEVVQDIDEVTDEVLNALERLHSRRRGFERRFSELVDEYAEKALFERVHEPVSVREWTADPWGDTFEVAPLVEEFLGISGDTADRVNKELRRANIIPSYPAVRVDVEDGKGLPDGFEIQALGEAGASGAETVDFLMTEHFELMGRNEWSDVRGADSSTVSHNVTGAKDQLSK